ARTSCEECAGLTGGVDRDAIPRARSLAHGGRKFLFGVLEWSGEVAVDDRVRPGLVDLDEVRALFELFADDGDKLRSVVGIRGVGQYVLFRVIADGVFVAAENVDGVAADA